MSSWIEEARAVASGARPAPPGWSVIRGERPALVDADGVRALVAPLVAALAWIGAVFRELVAGSTIDPLALFMRLLALATTARAMVLGRTLVERGAAWAAASRCALVLAPGGLYARLPGEEVALDRTDIVGIVERGTWQGRASGRRFSPVYVVSISPLRTHVELPAIFEVTPGVLAERLQRWRGAIEAPEAPVFPEKHALASKVYEDAAHGVRDPGTIVVHHGHGWLRRGPWATVLLGVAILEGFLRAEPAVRDAIGLEIAGVAVLACVAVPLIWAWRERRSIEPQLGMAMVLTSAELLMRVRGGVLRVHWPDLSRLSIDSRGRLSIVEGWAIHRALVIKRRDGLPITYDEAFLGVPAEVALELCDAYARGVHLAERGSGEQASELPDPGADRGREERDRGAGDAGDARGDDDVPPQA